MDLMPTISLALSVRDVHKAVEKIKRTSPDITVEELAEGMIDTAIDSIKETRIISSPIAVFLKSALEVSEFSGTVSMQFLHRGDVIFILASGDIINYSSDSRVEAERVLEQLNQ